MRILNLKAIAGTLGALLCFLGIALLAPVGVALYYGEVVWIDFVKTALLTLVVGGLAWYQWGGKSNELGVREGFAIVGLAWFVLSLLGALPFVLSGVLPSYADAFFETMSGFTTTGATIFGDGTRTPAIEDVPHAHLFWRSLTQWFGGMGIIVLTLAVLPILGIGGMQLFKAEVPGVEASKLTPRIRETAKRLWLLYVGFTAVLALLLLPKMNFFDAVNHAFTTLATGGYSTKNSSVGAFESLYVDVVITIFMFLGGVNFLLHYQMLRGKGLAMWRDTEFRFFLVLVVGAVLVISSDLWWAGMHTAGEALRYGAFQAVSIITSTGYGTADYLHWPTLSIGVLFSLFFVGGMAGSTAGGVKVIRHVLLFKHMQAELKLMVHPQALVPIRLNDKVVPPEIIRTALSFIVIFLFLVSAGTLVMTATGLDLIDALAATLASISNVGPSFGSFGPASNYGAITPFGKWFLAILMMIGRLEIFTVLILFAPTFWRR